MLLSLTAFCLFLHTLSPELAREAVIFRQSQLADAVLADDRQAMLVAIEAHANLNSPIVLTAERLTALAKVSSRLDHYFREETKATPLILAAALGEKERVERADVAAIHAARLEARHLAPAESRFRRKHSRRTRDYR